MLSESAERMGSTETQAVEVAIERLNRDTYDTLEDVVLRLREALYFKEEALREGNAWKANFYQNRIGRAKDDLRLLGYTDHTARTKLLRGDYGLNGTRVKPTLNKTQLRSVKTSAH
ncbi:hypothetical protein [Magnetospira sp. QH-2]|uniref:hypothetical protein n=1 Tax=Magnetospira sp. (strain QH-2) TaxID=1288970 RepID=UPI0003E818C5|nr:hypothetical protein [Magnetospira sp. QH-2]CCQ75750.1 Protein of unknown function [Magnetospira sp. QH-2]